MKKFTKIVENLENESFYKVEAEVVLIIEAENEGEAGYVADSILASIEDSYNYTINNIDKTDERITESKKEIKKIYMKLYNEKKRNDKVELRKAQKETEIKNKKILNEAENLIDYIKSTNEKNIDVSSNNQLVDTSDEKLKKKKERKNI